MRRLLLGSLATRCRAASRTPVVRHLSGARGPGSPFVPSAVPTSNRPIKTSCAGKPDADFRIVKDERLGALFERELLAGSNILLDDLELRLVTGESVSLNLTWLRDSCHCSLCTHKHSRQRLFTPKDFKRRLFEVSEVAIREGPLDGTEALGPATARGLNSRGLLQIRWADGHASQYSLAWLLSIDRLYASPRLQDLKSAIKRVNFPLPRDDLYAASLDRWHQQEPWDVARFQSKMEPVDYRDLVDRFEFHDDEPTFINANDTKTMTGRRFEAMLSLTRQLTWFGLAKIVRVPEQRNQVLRVARSLAYERPTGYGTVFDVVVEASEEINLAYSSQEFDIHSDLTYREVSPGVQLLHCIQNSDEGGVSYFSDTLRAADELQMMEPQLFEVLLQFPAVFVVRDPYRNVSFRRQKPVLSVDYQGELKEVYYSPFMLPPVGHRHDVKLFYLALDKLTQILQSSENKLKTKMRPGDLFIFHNRRVLHGRSSYDPAGGNRFLQGCYMDWDEVTCLHEKLASVNK